MRFPTGLALIAFLAAASVVAAEDAPLVKGKIVRVDASAGKITIDHQKIPNLHMDAMTMVYKASDPKMVAAVKPGDRIRFSAESVNGQLTVTKIVRVK